MIRKAARPDRDRSGGRRVEIQLATRAAALPPGSDLPAWAAAAGVTGRRAVTIRLVGWAEGRRLNQSYRHGTGATNVLAFPASARDPGTGHIGDLVICLPLVYREAREQGKKPRAHLAHMVVHGTLHLLGYDHEEAAAAGKMENREKKVLRALGFPDPYGKPAGRTAPGRRRA